ncbi:CheR family methyltransferase [Conexibacter woesei]|uniref:MCP methyltransferase, CheR-type n=1 Tax=Conexibacter woesei (strain DSM 14684 / CCUG 47730 / CIP 108061 / JCM 11494 / NBRC 100937 / ID131577) TaxID=469383 RepID=D3FDU1_CONWI|nr:CheR family methyltransferase [Conexibacter woesei]ADB51557.1 MCP methyltransferase, CheR-type [Conexibacter woesei DSM 14684]
MSDDLRVLAGMVQGASGIVLSDVQLTSLGAALRRVDPRLAATELLHDGDTARQARRLARLVDEVTVNETFFLRHEDELEEIDWAAAATRATSAGRRAVRVWSAGCSTGEEPYSLALLAAEALHSEHPPVGVLGSDISPTALGAAQRAVYGPRAVRLLDAGRRSRWCVADRGGLRVGDRLRALVRFMPHNLVTEPSPPEGEQPFDVIVCRNVLIYFDAPTVARVTAGFQAALAPGGQLLLGTADRLGSAPPPASPPTPPAPPGPRAGPGPRTPAGPQPSPRIDGTPDPVEAAAQAAFESGLRLLSDGDAASGVQALRRALYLAPGLAVAALQLGRGHEALGDEAAARRAYGQALALAEQAASPEARLYNRVGAADVVAASRARLTALARV